MVLMADKKHNLIFSSKTEAKYYTKILNLNRNVLKCE